jgi:hypothetical protein
LLAVSSIGFAKARHMAAGAETFVICTGYGLVQISVDAQGNPVEQTVPCPDCVPGAGKFLLAGAGPVPIAPASRYTLWIAPAQTLQGIPPLAWHHARAPPNVLV